MNNGQIILRASATLAGVAISFVFRAAHAMKKGKIILSIIAFLITVGSSLAFQAAHRFNAGPRVYIQTYGGRCLACRSVWTSWLSQGLSSCFTVRGLDKVFARNGRTFWVHIGPLNTCLTPVTKVSHSN